MFTVAMSGKLSEKLLQSVLRKMDNAVFIIRSKEFKEN